MKGNILVLKGQSLYNVLRIAADYMVEAFRKKDYDVTVLDLTLQDDANRLNDVLKEQFVLVFSFQALLFEFCLDNSKTAVFSLLKDTPVFGHIVDHPIYHNRRLETNHGENMYVGCIDNSHVDYIRKYYPGVKNAVFLPHAGFYAKKIITYHERSIDLYFPCSYTSPDDAKMEIDNLPEVYKNIAYQLISKLQKDPLSILQNELEIYLNSINFSYTPGEFTELMNLMGVVDRYIRAYERDKCVQVLVANDIKITVSGNGWDKFRTDYKDNIKIIGNNGLDFLEVLEVIGDSKMVLNNAPTYPYGTHERIFTSMLNGAICLTNDFPSIQDEFTDGENIILYSNQELQQFSSRIKYLLSNDSEAAEIAMKGTRFVEQTHTWDKNAESILKIVGLGDSIN